MIQRNAALSSTNLKTLKGQFLIHYTIQKKVKFINTNADFLNEEKSELCV